MSISFCECMRTKIYFSELTSPPCTASSSSQESNSNAYTIFTIAAALTGLGNAAFTILIVAYIDENTTKVQSPLYLGKNSQMYKINLFFNVTSNNRKTGVNVVALVN